MSRAGLRAGSRIALAAVTTSIVLSGCAELTADCGQDNYDPSTGVVTTAEDCQNDKQVAWMLVAGATVALMWGGSRLRDD